MNKACEILITKKDFACFCKLHSDNKTTICKVKTAYWTINKEGLILFHITADRFLRNMVRAIVGTMIDIGRHKIDLADFEKIIDSKNRNNAGFSVPADGLYLTEIKYPTSVYGG
jgi:tRNA pseudouridine38-40 synthase